MTNFEYYSQKLNNPIDISNTTWSSRVQWQRQWMWLKFFLTKVNWSVKLWSAVHNRTHFEVKFRFRAKIQSPTPLVWLSVSGVMEFLNTHLLTILINRSCIVKIDLGVFVFIFCIKIYIFFDPVYYIVKTCLTCWEEKIFSWNHFSNSLPLQHFSTTILILVYLLFHKSLKYIFNYQNMYHFFHFYKATYFTI